VAPAPGDGDPIGEGGVMSGDSARPGDGTTSGDTSQPGDRKTMVGESVDRREDLEHVTGSAEFTDDLGDEETLHAAILRSQYAHARILSIDAAEARSTDGVEAVFTGSDLASSGVPGEVPAWFSLPGPDDDPIYSIDRPVTTPQRRALATDVVRYAGEPIAVVLATDRYVADDAVGAIDVDYDRMDGVVDPVEAVEESPVEVHDGAPDNVAADWSVGDESAVDRAFERAHETVEYSLSNQRLLPTPMEPRAVMANRDAETGELRVDMSTQAPHHVREMLSTALDMPEAEIRVAAPAVGGGFGTKSKFYPAEVIVGWLAIETGESVKWVASRSESYLSGIHGREHDTTAELAFDGDGRITGLRVETHANVGAYVSKVAKVILTSSYATLLSGSYDIPAIHCRVIGAFTNTAPIDAYRGAGRPQATYVVERGLDIAARRLGYDPVALRRQNLIDPESQPFQTAIGPTYDSGDYEAAMDEALGMIDYQEFRRRQDRLREEGRHVGIGIANFVEECGLPEMEASEVRVDSSGTVTATVGTVEHGQGHRTTFAQVLADELGVPYDDIEIAEGDTGTIDEGTGTFASRSALAGGNSLRDSAGEILDKARRIAAHRLEAAEEDVDFEDGQFRIRGVHSRALSLQDVAEVAHSGDLPEGLEPGLEASTTYTPEETFPFGTHVAVVEVDPDTGEVAVERYGAVHDCGVQINPDIVRGQIHGGIAQGIGQALYEEAVYDETGNLLSGSMQDYVVPSSTQLPEVDVEFSVTPAPGNPLGVKGVGENGTLGPPAALVNAVADALEPFDVEHVEMPLTNESVWQAIER